MSVHLDIHDARGAILDYDLWRAHRAPLLNGFFQFWGQPRAFVDPQVLTDCTFYDMHITAYVRGWAPSSSPPAHPGMFADFFPTILSRIVGRSTLTLFVQATDRDSFDELEVVETLLAPKGLPYILLSRPAASADPRLQSGAFQIRLSVGYLFFQWPVDLARDIVDRWFMSPNVTVEGYVSREPMLSTIGRLCFQPDTEVRVRELLDSVEMGFRLWLDNNGLFVLTTKLNRAALENRLQIADLDRQLQEASGRYEIAP